MGEGGVEGDNKKRREKRREEKRIEGETFKIASKKTGILAAAGM
jgi:hypothetical protein